MACPCKKRVQKVVEYDRKLAGQKGEVSYETITEISEEEKEEVSSLASKILNPFIVLFKTLSIIALSIITIGIVIICIFVWLIWCSFAKFVLKRQPKINSPFYEYDKIKKRIKEHNKKIRENFFKSKKEQNPDKTIILKQ